MTNKTRKTIQKLKSKMQFKNVKEYIAFYDVERYPLCNVKMNTDDRLETYTIFVVLDMMHSTGIGVRSIDWVKGLCQNMRAKKYFDVENDMCFDCIDYFLNQNDFCKMMEVAIDEYMTLLIKKHD